MPPNRPFATLRQFVRPPPSPSPTRARAEQCELCGVALPPEHDHLIEPATRGLLCACAPCALLFESRQAGRYRRVPRRAEFLPDFRMTDARWDSLQIPVGLAYFFYSTPAGRVIALYPSPAGPTESLLSLGAWEELAEENPALGDLEPDVEALLVYRAGQAREHYRAPIDVCFRLVGLIRARWRGFSGGEEVWEAIGQFFGQLKERSGA